ncbi:hypothetical protein [Hymenobacter metallilatus]|uniref:DUF4249 domain-containing protein n=1 Tax=Hymenobacter metallilatus TaxID=2493666 RepID=A0A3R9LY92_9BACT|nr:hypothetical protein [Hymenobacter metallilatus]RSK25201.1 hypothetical protein EI290_17405 [Hymenobacter metallilatus]
MKKKYTGYTRRAARWLLSGTLLAAMLVGCQNETEILPNPGPEYYPLEVGTYRIYEVADTSWNNNVPKASRFQFREQVAAELSPDATGRPVYQVVRSRRATATDAWAVDSILTVTVAPQYIAEQRNNRGSVELVFPVAEGKAWNTNAFYSPDTSRTVNREPNRFYTQVDQPFSITRAGKTYAYESTITTLNDVKFDVNIFYYTVKRTTFAKNVGPVYRVRRRLIYCGSGNCTPNPAFIYQGQSRSEVLIESGR